MNIPNDDLTSLFVNRILRYYPFGYPSLKNAYSGQKEFIKIIEKKIEKYDSATPWYLLTQELERSIPEYRIQNFYLDQFPSYELNIELPQIKNELVEINQYLVLCASMLIPFYTLFIKSDCKLTAYLEQQESKKPFVNWIIHPKPLNVPFFENVITILNNVMSKYFPDYKFRPYKFLFLNTMSGYPPYGSGLDPNKDYTFYDYLFSNEMAGWPNVSMI